MIYPYWNVSEPESGFTTNQKLLSNLSDLKKLLVDVENFIINKANTRPNPRNQGCGVHRSFSVEPELFKI